MAYKNTRYKFGFGYTPPKTPSGPSAPADTKGVAPVNPALANAYAAKNPGWTPPALTGLVATPGAPGTPASAPVPPFMTGQDTINFGDAYKSHADQIAQSDKDLGDIKAAAQTALYNIGRNYLQGTDNTQNDAAGRGIFQSSIKDGALADLAATRATMTSDVNTRVNNAQVFHDGAIKRINDWWDNFQNGMNNIKVENASAAGPGDPGTPAGPTTYSLSSPPPPAAATPDKPQSAPFNTLYPFGFGYTPPPQQKINTRYKFGFGYSG